MGLLKELLRVLPWILLLIIVFWWWNQESSEQSGETIFNNSVMLREVEELGRIELVRYNFKEITELTEVSKEYFNLFKLGPDQKIALISTGEAAGCIDFSKMTHDDILISGDTVYMRLPAPEICYYKLDLDKTRIYSLQTSPVKEDGPFIQKAYKLAEEEIRKAALASGILEQTRQNAEIILRPFLEEVSGRTVIFSDKLDMRIQPENE